MRVRIPNVLNLNIIEWPKTCEIVFLTVFWAEMLIQKMPEFIGRSHISVKYEWCNRSKKAINYWSVCHSLVARKTSSLQLLLPFSIKILFVILDLTKNGGVLKSKKKTETKRPSIWKQRILIAHFICPSQFKWTKAMNYMRYVKLTTDMVRFILKHNYLTSTSKSSKTNCNCWIFLFQGKRFI